tara:strand:+ start:5586 stop:5813 length:228 start_codon:yes stop_codon:yes gene_type:complete
MEKNNTFDFFTSLIDQAFNKAFGKDELIEEPETQDLPYSSIEEYTQQTGKRFRLTKEEKTLGLTREEAFYLRFKN